MKTEEYLKEAKILFTSEFLRECPFHVQEERFNNILYKYNNCRERDFYLLKECVRRKKHCGFSLSCCVATAGQRPPVDYLSVDFPEEYRIKSLIMFNVGLLYHKDGMTWSILNDSLDIINDGMFTGGEESILKRIPLAVRDALDKVKTYLIPYIDRVNCYEGRPKESGR